MRRRSGVLAKDVRMPPDQLAGDRLYDIAERKCAGLLGNARMKDNLQKKIAQFVLQIVDIAARDRVRDLVCLLDRIGRDGLERLSTSHGQPVTGVRRVFMMSSSRPISGEGVMSRS